MPITTSYSVVRFVSDAARGEMLNVALLLFFDDRVEIRIGSKTDKIRSVSAGTEIELVLKLLRSIPSLLVEEIEEGFSPQEMIVQLRNKVPFGFSSVAEVHAANGAVFEILVQRLMSRLVEPEPRYGRIKASRPSAVSKQMKAIFAKTGILADRTEGIDSHRVVTNFTIADGIVADFALKNGSLHVIETVDAGASDTNVRKAIQDVATANLVFQSAAIQFGGIPTSPRLVCDISHAIEKVMEPSLEVSHQLGVQFYNWRNLDHRRLLIESIANLASPDAGYTTSLGIEDLVVTQPSGNRSQ
jgi:hypothetical protein